MQNFTVELDRFHFLAKPNTMAEQFKNSLCDLAVPECDMQFSSDLVGDVTHQIVLQHKDYSGLAPWVLESEPALRIIVVDNGSMAEVCDLELHGTLCIMCGFSNDEALLAFQAGVSAFYCLTASKQEREAQLKHLFSLYQARWQALYWRLASRQISSQNRCSINDLIDHLNLQKKGNQVSNEQIALRCGTDWEYVNWPHLRYVEAAGDYMCVYTQEDTLVVRSTLRELVKRLPRDLFVQINRSVLVNKNFVTRMVRLNPRVIYLELVDGSRLKISRRLIHQCTQLFTDLPIHNAENIHC